MLYLDPIIADGLHNPCDNSLTGAAWSQSSLATGFGRGLGFTLEYHLQELPQSYSFGAMGLRTQIWPHRSLTWIQFLGSKGTGGYESRLNTRWGVLVCHRWGFQIKSLRSKCWVLWVFLVKNHGSFGDTEGILGWQPQADWWCRPGDGSSSWFFLKWTAAISWSQRYTPQNHHTSPKSLGRNHADPVTRYSIRHCKGTWSLYLAYLAISQLHLLYLTMVGNHSPREIVTKNCRSIWLNLNDSQSWISVMFGFFPLPTFILGLYSVPQNSSCNPQRCSWKISFLWPFLVSMWI